MNNQPTWTCHLCKGHQKKVLTELLGKDGRPYHAVRCMECELLASDPMPHLDPETLQEIYSKAYYDGGWCDGGLGYEDPAKIASMEKEARDQRQEIERITKISQGSILDIGCSDGRYLKAFQEAGWTVAGVEVSQYSAKQACERLGVEILSQPIESLQLPEARYDLVRMKHSIEHLPEPRIAIEQIARALKPGGFAVIDTDNADAFRTQIENLFRSVIGRKSARSIVQKLTGKNLDSRYGRLCPPIHLYNFNLQNLSRLLEEAGLSVVFSLRPAQGHPIWFPQLHRYRCNPFEACFRLLDDMGGKMNKGLSLVVFAKKQ